MSYLGDVRTAPILPMLRRRYLCVLHILVKTTGLYIEMQEHKATIMLVDDKAERGTITAEESVAAVGFTLAPCWFSLSRFRDREDVPRVTALCRTHVAGDLQTLRPLIHFSSC